MDFPVNRRLREYLEAGAAERLVSDIRLGLGYTGVRLDDGGTGVAFTFRQSFHDGCTVFQGSRPLAGRRAGEVLSFLESTQALDAAVGLAAANALANRPHPDLIFGDILDILDLRPTDRVGMVGYFAPIMPKLRRLVAEVLVFEQVERRLRPGDKIHSAGEALKVLPQCQVALLTATALINGTMDELFKAATSCREVVVLGASTPLCPEAFLTTPVTLLSGVIVERPAELLQVISEGGGMRSFRGLVSKVNLRLKPGS